MPRTMHIVARFLSVGLVIALYQYVSFYVLWAVLDIKYLTASTVSFTTTVVFSFFMQRHITFREHTPTGGGMVRWSLALFFLNSGLGLGVNATIMYIGVDVLGLFPGIVQVISMGFLATYNFFIYRWLFSKF